jgi:ribosomal protein S18 acetylase RimI-like enzyme
MVCADSVGKVEMLTVRRLRGDDVEAYRAIRLEALEIAPPEAFASTLAREQAFSRENFIHRLESGCALGAFVGDALVGIVGLVVAAGEKERHKGTLVGMYVRESARGRGAGQALIEALLAVAIEEVEQVNLVVSASNVAARRLYERCGFGAYGLEKRSLKYRGQYFDDVLMVRFL